MVNVHWSPFASQFCCYSVPAAPPLFEVIMVIIGHPSQVWHPNHPKSPKDRTILRHSSLKDMDLALSFSSSLRLGLGIIGSLDSPFNWSQACRAWNSTQHDPGRPLVMLKHNNMGHYPNVLLQFLYVSMVSLKCIEVSCNYEHHAWIRLCASSCSTISIPKRFL